MARDRDVGSGVDATVDRLALRRRGLRFELAEVERAYQAWFLHEAAPYVRLGMAASALGWAMAWAGAGIGIPGTFGDIAPWILGVILPLVLVVLAVARRPRPAMLVAVAAANAIAGFVAVGPLADVVDQPEVASLGVIVIAYFGFAVIRLPLPLAALTVLSYTAFHQVLLVLDLRADTIETRGFVVNSVLPWVAFTTGLVVCAVLNRLSRETYRREQIIEAQGRAIAFERERADGLLRNILPESIADRLKAADDLIADEFDDVTVLFADLVGFTPLASTMDAQELVTLLNEVFVAFDRLLDGRGVEKIKTIGDAYMVVAGLPEPRPDHAEAIADLALDMRDELDDLRTRLGRELDFRIGIATGPAVAGVIGRSKFAYDLWGHTVNMAARMESHGTPGRIQLTEEAHARLAGRYRMRRRGKVKVKGAGTVTTWWLDDRKADAGAAPA